MPVLRRNFMKLFGISLGSLLLARCQRTTASEPTIVTCYQPTKALTPEGTASPESASLRTRLRLCWLRFGELAEETAGGGNSETGEEDPLGKQMTADHRAALDGLAASGAITTPVADLIQEAYEAAVYHVWRSNAPITCYRMSFVNYAPAGAKSLVRQAEALGRIAEGTPVAPETLDKIRTALEHDMAFYALTDDDVQALYDQLRTEYHDPGETIPSFEEVELALTPDAKAAADFLLDVLRER